MWLCACMPMPLHNEVQSDLEETRIQRDLAQKELESLKAKHEQTEVQLQWIELELSKSEAAISQLSKDLKQLQSQNAYLKNINQQQQKNIKALKLELEKRRSVIQLQGQVIQLLDDTKKTIETSLKDQIAAREIEIVEIDDKLKVIFVDKILFDSGSVEGRLFKRKQRTEYRGRGTHGRCPFKCRVAQTISQQLGAFNGPGSSRRSLFSARRRDSA
jgi:hypothetical protein